MLVVDVPERDLAEDPERVRDLEHDRGRQSIRQTPPDGAEEGVDVVHVLEGVPAEHETELPIEVVLNEELGDDFDPRRGT
jgi:hypothetical protein